MKKLILTALSLAAITGIVITAMCVPEERC